MSGRGQNREVLELRQRISSLEAQVVGLELAQVMTRSFAGEIRYWSLGMERLYGYTAEEALGEISHSLLRTEFPHSLRQQEDELLQAGEWTGELHHHHRDGQEIVVISHQSLAHYPAAQAPLVTEVNNDISGDWRAREARLYLASIVESSDDAIIGKTLDGIITAWNRAAQQMFGYSASEMIGRPISTLYPPDRADEAAMILNRLRRGERVHQSETVRQHKDGRAVNVSLTISPILNPSGQIIGASKIVRDISAERQNQSRISQLQAELAHAARLTTMGQLASAIAHELNQPLTAISNYAGALNRILTTDSPDLKVARSAVERVRQQAGRAGEVIRRLRDHVAKRDAIRQSEDLNATVSDAVDMALLGTRHQGIKLTLQLGAAVGAVPIDRVQIGQVIINLVRNAIEAMETSERRELTVATRALERAVEISVADTGAGIEPEVAGRLFQPFVTSKPTGMGLGLSICRDIVTAHGGELTTAPGLAGGTVFTLRLPFLSST